MIHYIILSNPLFVKRKTGERTPIDD
jgi:hypothetical protein